MEEERPLKLTLSAQLLEDLQDIFLKGIETFGIAQAEKYEAELFQIIEQLPENYQRYPECKYLPTRSQLYRWALHQSHYLIFKITSTEIKVLRALHSKRSITAIRSSRKAK